MAIKIGHREFDLLREPDGKTPVCHCGCGEMILDQEKVFWLYRTTRVKYGGLNTSGGPFSIVKMEHLIGAEKPQSKTDLDSLKSLMVALSHADETTLKKLYTFMHDALNCRV